MILILYMLWFYHRALYAEVFATQYFTYLNYFNIDMGLKKASNLSHPHSQAHWNAAQIPAGSNLFNIYAPFHSNCADFDCFMLLCLVPWPKEWEGIAQCPLLVIITLYCSPSIWLWTLGNGEGCSQSGHFTTSPHYNVSSMTEQHLNA